MNLNIKERFDIKCMSDIEKFTISCGLIITLMLIIYMLNRIVKGF